MHAQQHARDVAVDDGSPLAVHDARDRAGRVPADAGERRQVVRPLGHSAGEALDAGAGSLVQPTGTAVVAEPLPLGEDVVDGRGREPLDRWPASDERREAFDHPGDLGLLQHALTDECVITAPPPSPGQVARVLAEPPLDRGRQPLCRG